MTVRMALLAMLPACGFASPGGSDAGDDDGSDFKVCYGSRVPICFAAAPTAQRIFDTNLDIDTGASSLCDQDNDKKASYCVVAGERFVLSARVTAHGSKPLVLLSATTFELSGDIDVASHTSTQITGAGAASAADCPEITGATATSGGHGGTFSGKGGNGTPGNPDVGEEGAAAMEITTVPTVLRGGCPGGNGVSGDASMITGRGGAGGGAVAIVATTLSLNGRINASGGGGRGGSSNAIGGGGGGGSGGMIVLDAMISSRGGQELLWANGAGGGQGGGAVLGADGSESAAPIARALGGIGGSAGAFGGAGSQGADRAGQSAGTGAPVSSGGGGGGGGAGFIRASGITGDNVISPPSSDPLPP